LRSAQLSVFSRQFSANLTPNPALLFNPSLACSAGLQSLAARRQFSVFAEN
jgi:hypothetical protein